MHYALIAYQNIYGFEWQGDNLLIARENLLYTFIDYYEDHFGEKPAIDDVKHIAEIISWNIWQMDGLKDTVPLGKPYEEYHQMTLFEIVPDMTPQEEEPEAIPCKIYDWRSNNSLVFKKLKEN